MSNIELLFVEILPAVQNFSWFKLGFHKSWTGYFYQLLKDCVKKNRVKPEEFAIIQQDLRKKNIGKILSKNGTKIWEVDAKTKTVNS